MVLNLCIFLNSFAFKAHLYLSELLKDLIVLQDIHQEFAIITDRMRLVDSLYTEYTFDPFTYIPLPMTNNFILKNFF